MTIAELIRELMVLDPTIPVFISRSTLNNPVQLADIQLNGIEVLPAIDGKPAGVLLKSGVVTK